MKASPPEPRIFSCGDFSLSAPATWQRRAIITLQEPGPRSPPRSVVVTQELADDPALTVEEFSEQQQAELKARLPGFALERRDVWASGEASIPCVVYSWCPPQGPLLVQYQAYFLRDRRAFTLTGTTPREPGSDFEPIFQAIVRSFVASADGVTR